MVELEEFEEPEFDLVDLDEDDFEIDFNALGDAIEKAMKSRTPEQNALLLKAKTIALNETDLRKKNKHFWLFDWSRNIIYIRIKYIRGQKLIEKNIIVTENDTIKVKEFDPEIETLLSLKYDDLYNTDGLHDS